MKKAYPYIVVAAGEERRLGNAVASRAWASWEVALTVARKTAGPNQVVPVVECEPDGWHVSRSGRIVKTAGGRQRARRTEL